VDIGKVEQIELDPTLGQVSFKAELNEQYAARFLQSGRAMPWCRPRSGWEALPTSIP
jgi:paraquat-inducible protein B